MVSSSVFCQKNTLAQNKQEISAILCWLCQSADWLDYVISHLPFETICFFLWFRELKDGPSGMMLV